MMTAQFCQQLNCSPKFTQTHTHQHGLPYFLEVKQVYLNRRHRIIENHGRSDRHHCQATGLHLSLPPHVFLAKRRFTFPSRKKCKAAHRDNLRILTPRVHWQHFPPPLSFSLPRPSSAAPFAPVPPTLVHSSFPLPHVILIAPSPRLSGWFQACCVWPDLVSRDWNSNYDSLPIAFPPSEKCRYLFIRGLNPPLHADMWGPDNVFQSWKTIKLQLNYSSHDKG